MLQDIYYSRRSNKAVQVITQCRILPDGTEAVCFQEMSDDYEVFVLAKEHFVRIFQKPDGEEDGLKQAAVNQMKEAVEEQGVEDRPEKTAEERDAVEHPEKTVEEQRGVEPPETEEEEEEAMGQQQTAGEEEVISQPEETVAEEEETVPGIIRFLDAETYEAKMKVLESMRDDLDERTLNNMAVSLDLTINDGVDGYSFLMSELRIRSRYEGKRGQRL